MPSIIVSKEYQKKSEYAFQVEFLIYYREDI